MKGKLFFVVMALILVLPMTSSAGSKNYKGKKSDFRETPIEAPRDDVFDVCGAPVHTDADQPPPSFFTATGPYKLFDDFYYIGTNSRRGQVGSFVIDTHAGLIMIDAGWGPVDCDNMMGQLQELGFQPAEIKLILVSHEHLDHYGGVKKLKDTYCPSAKVAMSKVGWNYLRTWPEQISYEQPRPDSIDMYLKDEQIIHMGNKIVKIFYTPGHTPGCVSFVIPVRDRGKKHVVGIMGGTSTPRTVSENLVYWSSVAYFKDVCDKEKCDVGLGVHASNWLDDFETIQNLGRRDPNPLVIGTERFVNEYIQSYYDRADDALDTVPPEHYEGRGWPDQCDDLIAEKLIEYTDYIETYGNMICTEQP